MECLIGILTAMNQRRSYKQCPCNELHSRLDEQEMLGAQNFKFSFIGGYLYMMSDHSENDWEVVNHVMASSVCNTIHIEGLLLNLSRMWENPINHEFPFL